MESFFSASKIKEYEETIEKQITEIDKVKLLIENIVISKADFYSQFVDDIIEVEKQWNNVKENQVRFLSLLKEKMIEKSTKLFSVLTFEELSLPNLADSVIKKYNKIAEQNNSEDISRLKKFSKDLLRFDLIYTYIKRFDLTSEKNKLEDIKKGLDEFTSKLVKNGNEILNIDQNISKVREKISKEIEKTKSEKKLATNINKKLEIYVNFQLEHIEPTVGMHQGYYRIKSKSDNNDEYRDIETLSEGEKNIIGFLYF